MFLFRRPVVGLRSKGGPKPSLHSAVVFMSYHTVSLLWLAKAIPVRLISECFEKPSHLGLWQLPSPTAGFPHLCKHIENLITKMR